MKIICPKSVLAKGVNIVLKAVPSKTTMPILECILIDASNGKIKLTAKMCIRDRSDSDGL